ncbi:UDP-N-acetylglucosamine 2-epimerase [Saprospiraceae bacterium]|nr:UDP-N-acetylglucosamine 2-epimerase [Saprospiraceae bacterium]
MKVAVLTSSRADYGIYIPLLKLLKCDDFFELKIIAFGTHLSRYHGYTVDNIFKDGFEVSEQLETLILGDSEAAISNAMGNTISIFSSLWSKLADKLDLVIALGDRYEMFAAVAASIPFNLRIAHIHGGETTKGAIDNKFRHSITLMSELHFTCSDLYSSRIKELIGHECPVYNVGALSLDNLSNMDLLSVDQFRKEFNIDLSIPTVLSTFHPETVSVKMNENYAKVLVDVFEELSKDFQIVITMPNADTMGSLIRDFFTKLSVSNDRVICVENFGSLGYFSCMKHCFFILGNSSSGIVEAATLGKYVINVGNRQEGRLRNKNVIDVDINKSKIINAVMTVNGNYSGDNMFKNGECASQIINVLKELKY